MGHTDDGNFDAANLSDTDGSPDPLITEDPWYLEVGGPSYIRVSAITSTVPAVSPGEDVDYDLLFRPNPGAANHIHRYQATRALAEYTESVSVGLAQGTVWYQETHGGPDGVVLVYLAPLVADAEAVTSDGARPPERSAAVQSRWAVVTGIEDATMRADTWCELTLSTTTVGPGSRYPDRESARAATEENNW